MQYPWILKFSLWVHLIWIEDSIFFWVLLLSMRCWDHFEKLKTFHFWGKQQETGPELDGSILETLCFTFFQHLLENSRKKDSSCLTRIYLSMWCSRYQQHHFRSKLQSIAFWFYIFNASTKIFVSIQKPLGEPLVVLHSTKSPSTHAFLKLYRIFEGLQPENVQHCHFNECCSKSQGWGKWSGVLGDRGWCELEVWEPLVQCVSCLMSLTCSDCHTGREWGSCSIIKTKEKTLWRWERKTELQSGGSAILGSAEYECDCWVLLSLGVGTVNENWVRHLKGDSTYSCTPPAYRMLFAHTIKKRKKKKKELKERKSAASLLELPRLQLCFLKMFKYKVMWFRDWSLEKMKSSSSRLRVLWF